MWVGPPTNRRGTTGSVRRNDSQNNLATSTKSDERSREDETATKQPPMPRSRLGEPSPAALFPLTEGCRARCRLGSPICLVRRAILCCTPPYWRGVRSSRHVRVCSSHLSRIGRHTDFQRIMQVVPSRGSETRNPTPAPIHQRCSIAPPCYHGARRRQSMKRIFSEWSAVVAGPRSYGKCRLKYARKV
jgi:hypothetical protein